MTKHKEGDMCVRCGENPVRKGMKSKKDGAQLYRSYCRRCEKLEEVTYRNHKKDSCGECGFVPVHACQLDVDHIDNNHSNDDPANLQTLCANCHRLKTWHARWG